MTLRYYAVLLVPLLIPLSPLCADRRGLANKQHIASVQQKLEQLMNEDHVIGKKILYKTTSDNKSANDDQNPAVDWQRRVVVAVRTEGTNTRLEGSVELRKI